MSEQIRSLPGSHCCSRSSLLIPEFLLERFFVSSPRLKVGEKPLASYLRQLLDDPLLEYKLKFLKSDKRKKQYQKQGQVLRQVNFYPRNKDWARLSEISNTTGFSCSYVFLFLMLIDKEGPPV